MTAWRLRTRTPYILQEELSHSDQEALLQIQILLLISNTKPTTL